MFVLIHMHCGSEPLINDRDDISRSWNCQTFIAVYLELEQLADR
jgi:hypothetical protein